MKIVVIGLGNFGMSLAVQLASSGHEVIAADIDIKKIEQIKEKVSHAVAMDATNESAYFSLPLKSTDIAIMAIGENDGACLMSTAIIKKITDARIIVRSSSAIQDNILEAMGIKEIIHPEQRYAEQLTNRLNLKGSIENFKLDEKHLISEVGVIDKIVGKTIVESNFRNDYNLNIITILRRKEYTNFLGKKSYKNEGIGIPQPNTVFQANDVLVVFGKKTDIEKYLENNANSATN